MRPRLSVLTAVATLLAAASPPGAAAQASPDAAGRWRGALSVPGAELPLVFEIARDDDGGLTATWSSPAQGAVGLPVDAVTLTGDALVLEMRAIGGRYEGTLRGDTLEGEWMQGGQRLPLTLTRAAGGEGAGPVGPRRPQTPEPPFPYAEEAVRYPNPDAPGVELAGLFTVPGGPGPHPAVLLVSGSGPQDRNEALAGHEPFRVLADHLARRGIAVLRVDDRGVGESTGDFGEATRDDFVSDALAGVAWLAARPEVDGDAVGVVGHSEGGIVGPAAALDGDLDFVVMLAGPGLPGRDIVLLQSALIARATGQGDELVESNTRLLERVFDAVSAGADSAEVRAVMRREIRRQAEVLSPEQRRAAGLADEAGVETWLDGQLPPLLRPWFRSFLDYDPAPVLARVDVPVLALLGEKDLQVPAADNAAPIRAALEGGHPRSDLRVLPGLNHLFQTAGTGSPAEYAAIEETMAPAALEAVSGWILEVTGRR